MAGQPLVLAGIHVVIADEDQARSAALANLAGATGATVEIRRRVEATDATLPDAISDVLIVADGLWAQSGAFMLARLAAKGLPKAALPLVKISGGPGVRGLTASWGDQGDESGELALHSTADLASALCAALGLDAPSSETPDLTQIRRLSEIAGAGMRDKLFLQLEDDLKNALQMLNLAMREANTAGVKAQSHVLIALAGTVGAVSVHDDAVVLNTLSQSAALPEEAYRLARRIAYGVRRLLIALGSERARGGSLT